MNRDQLAAEALRKLKAAPTVSVVTAGQALGVGRHAAYDMARRGDVQVIKVGRHWRVVSAPLLRRLGQID